jgi:alginate O-acetyltransferase complex protein AlgI
MLFNSFVFILIFLPVALSAYHLLNRWRLPITAKSSLILCSLIFYGWGNFRNVPLILLSICVNYLTANFIHSPRKNSALTPKRLLVLGLFFNIALLGYFKYCDFFIININALADTHISLLRIALPLGISFFTLQQITFLIDTYEKLVNPKGVLDYALFVTFFPKLLAGPIVHHKQMVPQFDLPQNKIINYQNMVCGLFVFSIGLFKKSVLADSFAPVVRQAFDILPSLSFVEAWMASLSYTLQMYFDFSGYSDMAIGLGLLFNITIPINFNSPYKSRSLIEYWNRWHITLSLFINTYLYTPLVRKFGFSFYKSLLAILMAMFVAGLWHGASWTYVFWGVLHGTALCINHIWRQSTRRIPERLAWFLAFNFVNISYVFFRATSFSDAFKVLRGMAGFSSLFPEGFTFFDCFSLRIIQAPIYGNMAFSDIAIYLFLVFAAIFIVFFTRNSMEMKNDVKPDMKHYLWIIGCLFLSFLFMNSFAEKEFLYFEF